MSDSIISVYSDARTEYTKQLCTYLVPTYFQLFLSLFEKARELTKPEPKKLLWHFQTLLNDIPEWNMEKVNSEITQIQNSCGCDYLEDLLTAVFIAHTKVLTAIRINSKQNKDKVQISVPSVERFLFRVLCETSKLLWGSTYLFREDVSSIEKQQNYRQIESLIQEGVTQAIRGLVPVKNILKNFINNDDSDDEDDAEKEEKHEEKPEKKDEEKPEEMNESTSASVSEVSHPIQESATISEVPKNEVVSETTAAAVAVPESVEVSQPPVAEQAQPPIIHIDDKPEVSFTDFKAILDTDNPDGSDIVEDDEDASGLEIMDGDGMPLDEDLDFEELENENTAKELSSDDYEVLV
jgi:hypothetical protein